MYNIGSGGVTSLIDPGESSQPGCERFVLAAIELIENMTLV